ncbi:MAG: hypothetical protein L7U87_03630 [Chlamydiales bacterium]|nr:hypothetical protein [Chlamydiales bacterium]
MDFSSPIYVLSVFSQDLPYRSSYSSEKVNFKEGSGLGEAFVVSDTLDRKLNKLSSSSSRYASNYQQSLAIKQGDPLTYTEIAKSFTVAQAKRQEFQDDYRYIDTRNNARKIS